MSVAVNAAFFDPYHDASRAHTAEHSWDAPRWDNPMSTSGHRDSTSAHSQSTPTRPDNAPRTASQSSQQMAQRAPSPSSVARMSTMSESTSSFSGYDGITPSTSSASVDGRQSGPAKIKVRDLEHIQSFASEDMSAISGVRSRSRSRSRGPGEESPQYEISEMKVEHIIEMVAGLLTKITTTNDQQHEHLHRHASPTFDGPPHLSTHTNSVIAFHGKNIPSITILSYLSRINKYCPTSYEVFLSLLVYFDRMTERVNAGPMQSLRQANEAAMEHNQSMASSPSGSLDSDRMEGVTATTPQGTQTATPPSSGSLEKGQLQGRPGTPHSRSFQDESPPIPAEPAPIDAYDLSNFFVVDSFNIHRLVIAGVTCASKFFSDIFYTNSRYAKVGGLPLTELNHLELQFLLLNDFRLSIPVEEIEAYGTMLVEFYAREVVAQQKAAQAQVMQQRSLSESSEDSTHTVTAAA